MLRFNRQFSFRIAFRRRFSSDSNAEEKRKWWQWSPTLTRALRLVRVIGVSVGIYQVGYHAGMIDYIEDPEGHQEVLVRALLASSGSKSVLQESDEKVVRVKKIGEKIISAAIEIVASDIVAMTAEYDKSTEKRNELAAQIKEQKAILRRISGPWSYYVTDSAVVNAFVSDAFPKSIFVNQGLLTTINPTDDELAMIMAHELSHVIHDHNKGIVNFQYTVYLAQMVLFAFVDPIGLSSFLIDAVASHIASILLATHSRGNEEEADKTGIQILAKACFDTVKGSNIFVKLAQLSKDRESSWTDTHPSSDLRAKYLLEATELYNAPKDCIELKNDFILSKEYAKRHHKK
jgi:Zn-dependent protease with chaperone function